MWNFLQYTSREQAFKSLSQSSLELVGAKTRVGMGVQASKTVLKICYKLFLIYLGILILAVETTMRGDFAFKSLVGYSKNSDLGDEEKSGRAMERCSGRR